MNKTIKTLALILLSLLFGVYIISMLIYPFTQGDWKHVQEVWDRWQSLNVGIIALIASGAALYASHHYTNRQHEQDARQQERNLIAAKSCLPGALSELCIYTESCVAILEEAWNKIAKDLRTSPLSQKAPSLPNTHQDTFKNCISFAPEESGQHLAQILTKLQIQNSRLKRLEEEFTDTTKIYTTSNIKGRFNDLAELRWLIDCTFDYARRSSDHIEKKQPENWEVQYNELKINANIQQKIRP